MLSPSPSQQADPVQPLAQRPDCVGRVVVNYNVADRVERAIRSVSALVDEIFVVDSNSTEDTVGAWRL